MRAPEFRPSLDEVMIHHAFTWAARGTCARAQVGAVLAIDGRTVSSGYNGAPAGLPHCDCVAYHEQKDVDGVGVLNDRGAGCQVAVHAEANVVAFAAKAGISTDGSTLYTTLSPCRACAALLVNAGVVRVVAVDRYRLTDGEDLLRAAGVVFQFAEEL
jgi:dCMP deaminase